MTSDEQALLAAIAAAPDADLPRLVFSDWLQDRGDERFEWVRDRELFAWMGPTAQNPIPKLLDSLEVAYREEDDDRIGTLEDLLSRCGPSVVGPVVARLRGGHRWEEFAGGLAGRYPAALAENRIALEELLASGPDDTREVVLQLLVCAGQEDPAALRAVLRETLRPEEHFSSPAYWALRQATGPAAGAVIAEWLPGLEADVEHPSLDDEERSVRRLECLAEMAAAGSPQLTAVLRRAAAHRSHRFAAAAARGLAHVPEGQTEAAVMALRSVSNTEHFWNVIDLVQGVPRWQRLLADFVADPATPSAARLVVLRHLSHVEDGDWAAMAPVYEAGLKHRDTQTREYTLMTLQESNGPAEAVQVLLRAAAEDADLGVRQMALQSYAQRDDVTERQRVTAIAAALGDKELGMAERAGELMRLQGLTDVVADRLRGRLDSDDDQVRARAVAALARLGLEVEEVFRALRDPVVAVRRAAARGLGEVAVEGTNGLKRLRKALTDPDPVVREGVAMAVANMGTDGLAALPDLLAQARDPDARARAGALRGLAVIRSLDPKIDPALVRGLRDADPRAVLGALTGLATQYSLPAALQEAVLPLTRHERPDIRRAAFKALDGLDESDVMLEVLKAFVRGLEDEDESVGEAAGEAARTVVKACDPVAEALVGLLERPDCRRPFDAQYLLKGIPAGPPASLRLLAAADARVRDRGLQLLEWACEDRKEELPTLATAAAPHLAAMLAGARGDKLLAVLGLIDLAGPLAADCLPALLPLLDHSNQAIREKALATVGRLGKAALPVAGRLTDVMLNAANAADRAAAAAGVTSLAVHDPALIPAVVRLLREGSPEVRLAIAKRCALHPPLGAHVIPPLARCLAPEAGTELRNTAIATLGKMGDAMRPQALNFARVLVKEPDENVRVRIVEAFADLGEAAADAVPVLMKQFKQEGAELRDKLVRAFGKIPCPERGAAVALGLTDPDPQVRDTAGSAVVEIGTDAVPILPAICKALADPEWDGMNDFLTANGFDRRQLLLQALGALGTKAEPTLPTLVKLLNEDKERFVCYLIETLAAIGAAAIPALKKAARHRDDDIRQAAEAALTRVKEGT